MWKWRLNWPAINVTYNALKRKLYYRVIHIQTSANKPTQKQQPSVGAEVSGNRCHGTKTSFSPRRAVNLTPLMLLREIITAPPFLQRVLPTIPPIDIQSGKAPKLFIRFFPTHSVRHTNTAGHSRKPFWFTGSSCSRPQRLHPTHTRTIQTRNSLVKFPHHCTTLTSQSTHFTICPTSVCHNHHQK